MWVHVVVIIVIVAVATSAVHLFIEATSTTYIMSWLHFRQVHTSFTRLGYPVPLKNGTSYRICVRNLSCQPQGRRGGNLATSGCTVINFTPAERRDAVISHFASPSRILHFNSCKMHFAFFSCDCSSLDTQSTVQLHPHATHY